MTLGTSSYLQFKLCQFNDVSFELSVNFCYLHKSEERIVRQSVNILEIIFTNAFYNGSTSIIIIVRILNC